MLEQFWQSLGSVVVKMTPEEHDKALAVSSHLPHLAAAALVLTVPEQVVSVRRYGHDGYDARGGRRSGAMAADPDAQPRQRAVGVGGVRWQACRVACWRCATTIRAKSIVFSPSPKRAAMLWEVDIYAAEGQPDLDRAATWRRLGRRIASCQGFGRHGGPRIPDPRRSGPSSDRTDRRRTAVGPRRRANGRALRSALGDAWRWCGESGVGRSTKYGRAHWIHVLPSSPSRA